MSGNEITWSPLLETWLVEINLGVFQFASKAAAETFLDGYEQRKRDGQSESSGMSDDLPKVAQPQFYDETDCGRDDSIPGNCCRSVSRCGGNRGQRSPR